jgi:hypothetical protein
VAIAGHWLISLSTGGPILRPRRRALASGLYMICTISKHIAERKGYADAMMLDWQGRVAECTGANIFFVKTGRIHTPIADCFLDGITRRTAIGLARKRGLEVIERRILPEELSQFSECFITGSAAEVTAVSEIARGGSRGIITEQLMADYTAEIAEGQEGGGDGRKAMCTLAQRYAAGERGNLAIPRPRVDQGRPASARSSSEDWRRSRRSVRASTLFRTARGS